MSEPRILILSPDLSLTSALEEKLAAAGWTETLVEGGYPSPGQVTRLVHEFRPTVIIVGLSEADRGLALIEDLHVSYPGILLAAAHSVNVPDLILSSVRSGASEYLGPPFEVDHLERVLQEKRTSPGVPQPKGRMISLVPAGGGSGASTVALHLASAMARLTKTKVLFLDWDFHCGTAAFRLRQKPEFTLGDALARGGSLDEFWDKLVCSVKGLDLLAAPLPDRITAEDVGRIPSVVSSARRNYEWIVSDLPPAVHGSEPVLLESEAVYMVCTPDVISLHLARRRFEEIRRLGVDADAIKLIVNRETGVSFRPDEIRRLVGIPVVRTLPNDPRSISAAWLEGRLVEDNTDFGKPLYRFAQEVVGAQQPEAKKGPSKSWRPFPKIAAARA